MCFAGDGCFLMTGQELATAVQYQLPIVIIVVNNGMYGTIRMHQEREYPARVYGTTLVNPDFAALAHAFGAHGEVVETTEQFAPAFERALQAGKPALLELRLDPEAISPNATLSRSRSRPLARASRPVLSMPPMTVHRYWFWSYYDPAHRWRNRCARSESKPHTETQENRQTPGGF